MADVPQHTQIVGTNEIKLGSKLNLRCATEADPPADKYNWYFKAEHEQHFLTISCTAQDYQIKKVTVNNAGFYKCSAMNDIGPGANSTEMIVLVLCKYVY